LPDEIYFAMEFMAENERRTVNDELIIVLEKHIDKYRKQKGLDEIPLTERRKKKLVK
jgi:hypothetical protein